MRRGHIAVALLLASCGSRTDLDIAGASPTDASLQSSIDAGHHSLPPSDATLDAPHLADAGADVPGAGDALADAGDGGVDAAVDAACTPSTAVATTANCNVPDCCKFQVTWSCGSQMLSASGSCQGTTGGYVGDCSVNGSFESSFTSSATSCLCDDDGALAAFVQSVCEVAPPPKPP